MTSNIEQLRRVEECLRDLAAEKAAIQHTPRVTPRPWSEYCRRPGMRQPHDYDPYAGDEPGCTGCVRRDEISAQEEILRREHFVLTGKALRGVAHAGASGVSERKFGAIMVDPQFKNDQQRMEAAGVERSQFYKRKRKWRAKQVS